MMTSKHEIRARVSPGDEDLFTLQGESWLVWMNREEACQAFRYLGRVLSLHVHADPCEDEAYPYRAAEHDHMIDMGAMKGHKKGAAL